MKDKSEQKVSNRRLPYRERVAQAVVPQVAMPGHQLETRKPISPAARQAMIDRVDTGAILARLERNFHNEPRIDGTLEPRLDASQLASAKLILDRTLPTLQAVDHLHRLDDTDKMTEAEIMERLQAALAADPGMLKALGYVRVGTKEKPVTIPAQEEGEDLI